MITLAEYVIAQYNEVLNNERTEEEFVNLVADALSRINELYCKEGDLDFPPEELRGGANSVQILYPAYTIFRFFMEVNTFYRERK